MKIQPLKGMRDLLPAEQTLRDYIQGQILEVYRAAGFERISTPLLEDLENLDKSEGGENLNLIFKVLKRGDKLAAALAAGSTTPHTGMSFSAVSTSRAVVDTVPQAMTIAFKSKVRRKATSCRA